MAETMEQLLAAIKQGAGERDLLAYPHAPAIEKLGPIALWNADWPEFLDLAKRAGATMLYTQTTEFDLESVVRDAAGYEEEVDSAQGSLDAEGDSDDAIGGEARWLYERLMDRVGQWASYSGSVGSVGCVWFKEGVAHLFFREAEWSQKCSEAIDQLVAEAEFTSTAARQARTAEEATRIYRLADELARHERFSDATSEAKRQFMAQQLFPDEQEPRTHRRIAELATLIYWWEIEPLERVTKVERARALYEQGESMANIAAILKMPQTKVKAAIAGTNGSDN